MELEKLLKDKLGELGYDLYSLNISYEKGDKILSIVVDRVEPIDMEAIVELSRSLNAFLDEIDPFDTPYTLDISSLGAEKPLNKGYLAPYIN